MLHYTAAGSSIKTSGPKRNHARPNRRPEGEAKSLNVRTETPPDLLAASTCHAAHLAEMHSWASHTEERPHALNSPSTHSARGLLRLHLRGLDRLGTDAGGGTSGPISGLCAS